MRDAAPATGPAARPHSPGLSYAVEPGGLGPEHHERIHALAAQGHGASWIARRIGKHPGAVGWFMYRNGLRPPGTAETPRSYVRNGRVVHVYTRDEDAFIEARRAEGLTLRAIAALVEERFGRRRSAHGIHCRLVMLAGRDDLAGGGAHG